MVPEARAAAGLLEPALRVVDQAQPRRGGDQPVVRVVDVGGAAVGGQVAVGVVGVSRPADAGILVQPSPGCLAARDIALADDTSRLTCTPPHWLYPE